MNQLISFERRDIVRWALAVVCCGWLLGATLHVVTNGASPMLLEGNNYMTYEQRLAACNELRGGSQVRYDCTSKLMLGRDRSLFAKILIVLLPPLGLISGIGLFNVIVRMRGERDRARKARDLAHAQMNAYREKLAQEEAEIASGVRKEEKFLDEDGNLVEAPSRFARWKE